MFEKRYVPLASDAGYYQILQNGKFFESCDIGEISQRMRELCGNDTIQRSKLTNILNTLKEVASC